MCLTDEHDIYTVIVYSSPYAHMNYISLIVESFEVVISTYAQQPSLNEIQNFTTPSLTLVTELVST